MTQLQTSPLPAVSPSEFLPPPYEHPHVVRQFDELLKSVSEVIVPVWPLKDYVAVNPYSGISARPFLDARAFLKVFSDCETLMPLEHYAHQYQLGRFGAADIEAAIGELQSIGIGTPRPMSAQAIEQQLKQTTVSPGATEVISSNSNSNRRLRSLSETYDRHSDVNWTEAIRDEVSKLCAAHYDEGEAEWSSPWKQLPLYQAWRSASVHDRNIEALGMSGFRRFVARLPHTAEAAILHCLNLLGVPQQLWEAFLLCQAFTIPGWSAWAKYKDTQGESALGNDLVGLLAVRLAYDAALCEAFAFSVQWSSFNHTEAAVFQSPTSEAGDDSLLRYTLLRASEISYRNQLLASLSVGIPTASKRNLAQVVFCIDVRSERYRRHLEAMTPEIETFGFAGFFGMPLEFVPLGDRQGNSHVPVLLKPQFQLHEGLQDTESPREAKAIADRTTARTWRNLIKRFQTSSIGCFSFVETTGLWYGLKLAGRLAGFGQQRSPQFDGLSGQDCLHLGPTLRGLNHQGITTTRQIELAESMLKNLGLTKDFAPLVVFCGHASQTENNPLSAGLDCGACGGHSGEPNARFAAMLLNQTYIRQGLAERGIEIPADTYFLAGLHHTTTDQIEYFDLADIPESHRGEFRELVNCSKFASQRTRRERMPIVASKTTSDLLRRARDWSEVRPEWGLAGNAAFIVAPRSMTRNVHLDGRSFLHSYDHRSDPNGEVLETIMTAPMIVAHWINMQYYASTVDDDHFGSGNKTVHNVVGGFGILSGNGGDLMTGLPWQSLHTGDHYQHLPMRLQAVIAAPRDSIDRVIEKHQVVANLVTGGWLHLIAIDQGDAYRYAADGSWQQVDTSMNQSLQPVC